MTIKICHLITTLGSGGAEKNLKELVNNIKNYDNVIITLKKNNFFKNQIKKNCKIYCLDFKYNVTVLFEFIKLIKILNNEKPKILMAWMYHSIFLSILIKCFNKAKIIWNVRHSNVKLRYTKLKTIVLIFLCSIFSFFVPKRIIYNSKSSQKIHENKFFSKKQSVLIYNGYKNFFYKKKYFKEFTISLIGRNSPQKNHDIFFEAINLLPLKNNINFILIGKDIPMLKIKYKKILNKKIFKKIKFFNEKKNIFYFYKKIDLNILPSTYGESFSNVIAETMSYGIPNIVSDIGENKIVVGKTGQILINPKSAIELKTKILNNYYLWKNKKKWRAIQLKCLNRIKKNFNLDKTIKKYEKTFGNI